ncbi:MAG TPA: hypothetical protein VMT96_00950 [Candidatus Bathyarchaeia archaeon]|nr:hypothetical protein [Candidatus Bathyarchaeia archaeon]
MNKFFVGAAVVLLFVVGGVVIILKSESSTGTTSYSKSSVASTPVSACDVLTQNIAEQILGPNLTHPDANAGDNSTADLAVSNCSYMTQIDANAKSSGVDVMVRAATTNAGTQNNKNEFGAYTTAGATTVKGFGDDAFYDPTFHTLNVLKGGNWYIITSFADNVTNANLDSDKALAEQLILK